MAPHPHFRSSGKQEAQPLSQDELSQQQTIPVPTVTASLDPLDPILSSKPLNKRKYTRIFAIILTLVLGAALFFIWHSPTAATTVPGISQQNLNGASSTDNGGTTSSTTDSGEIQVYVVGAVKHPGVYTLPTDARVFQLLQAAGGALPNANLVALNLAAKLTDGEEVYVLAVGETPPSYVGGVPQPGGTATTGNGQLININTATVDELRQGLHLSSTTAQNIVNYRLQHGPYTSVDQLLQVVSRSIYDRIKDLVTV